MTMIKKNGSEVEFDPNKIIISIVKANSCIPQEFRMSEGRMRLISKEAKEYFEKYFEKKNKVVTYADVRDLVETKIIGIGSAALVKCYIKYGAIQGLTATV